MYYRNYLHVSLKQLDCRWYLWVLPRSRHHPGYALQSRLPSLSTPYNAVWPRGAVWWADTDADQTYKALKTQQGVVAMCLDWEGLPVSSKYCCKCLPCDDDFWVGVGAQRPCSSSDWPLLTLLQTECWLLWKPNHIIFCFSSTGPCWQDFLLFLFVFIFKYENVLMKMTHLLMITHHLLQVHSSNYFVRQHFFS